MGNTKKEYAMLVICRKNGANSGIFTDGKVYDVRSSTGTAYVIFDDKGYQRIILIGVPSAHLMLWGDAVGTFEKVK